MAICEIRLIHDIGTHDSKSVNLCKIIEARRCAYCPQFYCVTGECAQYGCTEVLRDMWVSTTGITGWILRKGSRTVLMRLMCRARMLFLCDCRWRKRAGRQRQRHNRRQKRSGLLYIEGSVVCLEILVNALYQPHICMCFSCSDGFHVSINLFS
jgi:hypothetical protein